MLEKALLQTFNDRYPKSSLWITSISKCQNQKNSAEGEIWIELKIIVNEILLAWGLRDTIDWNNKYLGQNQNREQKAVEVLRKH